MDKNYNLERKLVEFRGFKKHLHYMIIVDGKEFLLGTIQVTTDRTMLEFKVSVVETNMDKSFHTFADAQRYLFIEWKKVMSKGFDDVESFLKLSEIPEGIKDDVVL